MKKYQLLIILLLIFVSITNVYAFSLNELTAKLDVDKANRLMKKGDYDGAITLYEKALSKVPNSPEIFYNMGTTMSSIGDLNSAIQLFDMAKKNSTEKTSKEIKHYNAGLTRIEGEDYQGAINELVESLVNAPNDNNAKRALEYAYKKLEEQKNQNNTGPSTQQDNKENQSGQSDNNNGNSGQNDENNNNQDNNQGDQNSQNNQNNDQNNQDNQDNQNNQNSSNGEDNQNNNDNNNQDNNSNNNDDQDNNSNQNEDNQDSKSDIDRLLESLRQYRKDKDNGDQYYGGGRIDKDW